MEHKSKSVQDGSRGVQQPAVHAILGCDTISQVHGIDKGAALKKVYTSPLFSQQATVFTKEVASKNDM